MSPFPQLSFSGNIYVQHDMKNENITTTMSSTTVFPRKREKGRIARRLANVKTDSFMIVLSLSSRQKGRKLKIWAKHQQMEL